MTSDAAWRVRIGRRRAVGLAVGLAGIVVVAAVAVWNYMLPAVLINAHYLSGPPAGEYRADIGGQIEAWASSTNVGRQLALSDIATLDWDRVVVLGAYPTNDQAADALGFDWNVENAPQTMIGSDSVNLVCFALDDHVVAWSDVGGSAFRPPWPEDWLLLRRTDAVLTWTGTEFAP